MLREMPASCRSRACRLPRPWLSGARLFLYGLSGTVGSWSRGAVRIRARASWTRLTRTVLTRTVLAGTGLRRRVTTGLPGTCRAAARRSRTRLTPTRWSWTRLSWTHRPMLRRARTGPVSRAVPSRRTARRTGRRLAIPGARLRAWTILLARAIGGRTVLAGTELFRAKLLRAGAGSLLAGAELTRSRRPLLRHWSSPLLVWAPPLSSWVLCSGRLRARAVPGLADGRHAVRGRSPVLLIRSLRTGPLLLAGTVRWTRTVLPSRAVRAARTVLATRTVVGARCLRARGLRGRTVLAVRSLRTRTVSGRRLRARRIRSPRSWCLRAMSERAAAELRSRRPVGSIIRRASAPPWPARRGARAADAGRRLVGELPGAAHRIVGCLPRGMRRYGPIRAGPHRVGRNVRGAWFPAVPRVAGIDRVCLRVQVGPLRLRIPAGRPRHVPGGPAVPTIHPVPPGLTFRAASRWRRAARLACGGPRPLRSIHPRYRV